MVSKIPVRAHQPVALVTGASSGFGRLTAERLSQDGFRTFGTSRRPVSSEVSGVEMLRLDVRSDDSVTACVDEVKSRSGRIDVVVNNAGILNVGAAEEYTLEEAKALFETNFFGVVRVTNAVLPSMREAGSGRVINVSSLAGLLAPPGEAFYAASKFAIEGYSEALSYEVAPFGIAISLIEPGFFKTNLNRTNPELSGSIRAYDSFRQAIRASIQKNLDSGGDPAEIADLVSRVARSQQTKLRYRVGGDAVWTPRLRRLMPEKLYIWGLRREFGIHKLPRSRQGEG